MNPSYYRENKHKKNTTIIIDAGTIIYYLGIIY